jgi:hypothetical protein
MKSTATLTIRNVPMRVVKGLKSLARQHGHSMEQEVRALLEEQVADRGAVLQRIRASWPRQARRPRTAEIDRWIEAGRG